MPDAHPQAVQVPDVADPAGGDAAAAVVAAAAAVMAAEVVAAAAEVVGEALAHTHLLRSVSYP